MALFIVQSAVCPITTIYSVFPVLSVKAYPLIDGHVWKELETAAIHCGAVKYFLGVLECLN